MFDFNKPKIEITEISDDKKYGRFVVEPLERNRNYHEPEESCDQEHKRKQ